MKSLILKTKYSERKLRSLIKELRKEGKKNGFVINNVKGQGYILKILDDEKYKKFETLMDTSHELDVGNRDVRVCMILYYLICTKGFCTIETLSTLLDVSSRTITNDLQAVKRILKDRRLSLYSKTHYGIKIIGDEWQIRKLFSKVANEMEENNLRYPSNERLSLLKEDNEIKKVLHEIFLKNNILMTATSIDAIVLHLWILLFRVKENNYVTEININDDIIDERYYTAATEVIHYLEKEYDMRVSKPEVDLLTSQFFGKSILEDTPLQDKEEMIDSIQNVQSCNL